MRFSSSLYLYLLWLAPLLTAWWVTLARKRETRLDILVSPAMRKKLMPSFALKRLTWQIILSGSAAFLMLLACARPQWGSKEQKVFKRGRDLIIALDVSRSMLARDVHPNRLQRAKIDILDLLNDLQGDRAGLVAFRRKGALICPLTSDMGFLRQALEGADIHSAPQGETDIGSAIQHSLNSFDQQSLSHKAIILISDGEDLTGGAIEAAKEAGKTGIPIFTVGLGSEAGATLPGHKTEILKHHGSNVISRLDNKTLYEIAKISGGAYIPVQTATMTSTTLGTLYREYLSKIAASDMQESIHTAYIERYQLFLLPAILLAIGACLASQGRLASQRKAGTTALAALAALTFCIPAASISAQANMPLINEPVTDTVTDVSKSDFETAAESYEKEAESASGRRRNDLLYNAAVSFYKAGKYERSAEILESLQINDAPSRARINNALGSTLYRSAGTNVEEVTSESLSNRAELLERSGNALAEASRASKNSNLYRQELSAVMSELPDAKNEAKIAGLLKKYEQSDAAKTTAELLNKQRELVIDMMSANTNAGPERLRMLEDLGRRQADIADIWIPLKGKLLSALESSTNSAQIQVEAERIIEINRDAMNNSSQRLLDMHPDSMESVLVSEQGAYLLWKGIAPYEMVLDEAILRQTNGMDLVSEKTISNRPDQTLVSELEETANLSDLFVERFVSALPESDSAAQQIPNDEPNAGQQITPEIRKKILELAKGAREDQDAAIALASQNKIQESLPFQKDSYEKLMEIRELLPKQEQQQDQQEQDNQDQQSDQSENNQQDDKQEQEENQNEDKDEQEPPKDLKDKEVQDLLQKALDREKEYKEQKKQKESFSIPLPSERDW